MSVKTKFLRFKKLPQLEAFASSKGVGPNASPQDPKLATARCFRQETFRGSDLMQALEGILQKGSKDYDCEPRDRTVVVNLPDYDESEELPDDVLKMWITEVCNKVISCAFNLMSTDQLSYEQTKICCSEGILRNIVLLVKKYILSKEQIKIINHHIEQNIIKYLKRKYPMTQSSDVNKSLDEAIKPIDKTEALQNDLLQKSGIVFTYRKEANYNDLIMKFLNWLMTDIDTTIKDSNPDKTAYEGFFNSMANIFQKVYNENWMKKKTQQAIHKQKAGQGSLAQIVEEYENNANDVPNQKYAQQVKEYTQYIIGRKIPKNAHIYSTQEIEEGQLTIKNPAILRILTKWCQELQQKFKTKNYFLDRQENVKVQEKNGNINSMFMWMKIPLNDQVQKEKEQIQKVMELIQKNNFDQQTELLKQQLFEDDGFYHVQKIEKVCGKFAARTVNNLHSYIVLYLNNLIHGLLKVSKNLYEQKLSTKSRWTSPPDLITFTVGDLMRCKCSSKEREILNIYRELEKISSNEQDKRFKIIRVKNRLKLGTNDILINILYQQKYLCEIQLAVKSSQSKFISCSNNFNHYIYELGRTLFGPLTQLSSVWMSLDPRAGQYKYIIQNEEPKYLLEEISCPYDKAKWKENKDAKDANRKQHKFVDQIRPFICSNCNRAYSTTNYFQGHQKCRQEGCKYDICAICIIEKTDQEKLKEKFLKNHKELLCACTKVVNKRQKPQPQIPTYGVCIPFNSKKIKVQKFRKLQYRKITGIYGFKESENDENDTKQQKVILIEELTKKSSQRDFFKKYLVFEIDKEKGKDLIKIDIDKVKKDYILPAKVKTVYKKQQEIMCLIGENLQDDLIQQVMQGDRSGESGKANIKNMQLADNQLTKIDFITKNFPNLQRLQLSRNKIQTIETVHDLKKLKKLNVRNNCIKVLPDKLCQLEHLQGLNIRHNQITQLPKEIGKLKLLDKLQSDNNLIKELPQSFHDLEKLKFIDLSYNKLTVFPEVFKQLKHLEELHLAGNKLGEVPHWIVNFKPTLVKLDLSKTGLKNFQQNLYELQKLDMFKIKSEHYSLSDKISKLSCLKELHIQMAMVSTLPKQIFQLEHLETLQIEDCHISQLPDLSKMKILTTLNLTNNKLGKQSKELAKVTSLRNLKLEGQELQELDPSLGKLIGLRTLSLNHNKFSKFPDVVLKFSKLYSLSIAGNNLQSIPENITSLLPDLQVIQFEKNSIKVLPQSLKKLRVLKKLTFDRDSVEIPDWLKDLQAGINRNNQEGNPNSSLNIISSLGFSDVLLEIINMV